ncbi:MAG: fatty acid oxidation complex subunit alpha FadJ [Deltaproteobacteria bacterium]|nr:fatty acid oxidation complex subunit alpha FadJ [Deltaproteobacteria bacterium]
MNQPAEKLPQNFRVEIEDGVAVVFIDVPGESVNTINPALGEELTPLVESLDRDPAVKAIVFASGKKDGFVAGADVAMLQRVRSAAEAESLARAGQRGFDRLERLQKPVVAAIHGACLGGGLEWALACHWRIATDDRKTVLGQPEVQLGVIPGAGGTQRLPRLIGIAQALDIILAGKSVKARKALKLGLVDEVVPPPVLLQVARQRAAELASGKLRREVPAGLKKLKVHGLVAAATQAVLEENAVGRSLLFREARKKLLRKTRGHYPAPEKALQAVQQGYERGFEKGLLLEARLFGELAVSDVARRLMEIFFATTALKKDSGVADPSVKARPVRRIGVLGGGLMGSGIAYVSANAGIAARIREKDASSAARAFGAVKAGFDERVKRKSLTRVERDQAMRLVTTATDWSGFEGVDLLVEAVFEDLSLKQEMVRAFEAVNAGGIFATNTSSIPIGKIAAAAKRPELVLGMHYFSPVPKMPLLEIIVTSKTAPEAVATAVAVGKRQGKTVIVVNDGPGFYTSRILSPYMNEAARLLIEGADIAELDRALVEWGFPVGPITLLDEVGIDVGDKVGKVMTEAFGERLRAPGELHKLVEAGRLGRKSKKGFYTYGGKKKEVDPTMYDLLPGGRNRKRFDRAAMAERVALQMVNEAILCLGEGILRSARDGDIGAIFGLGFPPFRGGPFRHADAVGTRALLEAMRRLEAQHGARFAPAPLLVEKGQAGSNFHG